MTIPELTLLQKANLAFRNGDYKLALNLYTQLRRDSDLNNLQFIELQINLCRKHTRVNVSKNKGSNKKSNELKTDVQAEQKGIKRIKENVEIFKRKTAVILLHVYHIEKLNEIKQRLEFVDRKFDLVITCAPEKRLEITNIFETINRQFEIIPVPNEGYDLYPFLKAFLYAKRSGYKIFCKVHTKRDHPAEHIRTHWRESLLDGVFPNKENVNKIVAELLSNEDISIAASGINYISYQATKYENDNYLTPILNQMGQFIPKSDFGFIAGTMFWGRFDDFTFINRALIRYLKKLGPSQVISGSDSGVWQAFERVLSLPAISNYKNLLTIDYDLGQSGNNIILRKKSSKSFLKYSALLRFKAYRNRHMQRKYALLQQSQVVDPEWCYVNFDKKAPYDCYQAYLKEEIDCLSSAHKRKELNIRWEGLSLIKSEHDREQKLTLKSYFLTDNIDTDWSQEFQPKLISEKDEIFVSVICITFMHEKFIRQALDSIVNQKTDFKFEVLVSDDCSPDNSKEIINEYVERYPDTLIYVSRDKNLGSRKNSIDLMQRARGKYIAFNEGDDFWTDRDKLQVQVDYLENNPECCLCFHRVVIVDEKQQRMVGVFPRNLSKSVFITDDLISRNLIQTNSLVFRKSNLGISTLPDERIMPGDWYRSILNSVVGDAHLLPGVYSAYRKHSGGIWSGDRPEHKWSLEQTVFFECLDRQFNYIYSPKIFGRKLRSFRDAFCYYYEKNDGVKLFELSNINIELTNFFMKRNGISFVMRIDLDYDEFVELLSDALAIDIVVTSYNHETYIKQALESVLDQVGLFRLKIYVSDDCSTDKSAEIIDEIVARDSDKVFNISPPTNLGLPQNLKHAFSHIQSRFFAICEGDDYWVSTGKLRKQISFLLKNDDVSMCFNWILLHHVEQNYSTPHEGQSLIDSEFVDFEFILKTAATANFSCCMYRSAVLKNIPAIYYELETSADWLFNLCVADQGKVGFIRDILSVYRVHKNGQWSKLDKNEKQKRFNRTMRNLKQMFPGRVECVEKYEEGHHEDALPEIDLSKPLTLNNDDFLFHIDKKNYEFGFLDVSGWCFLNQNVQNTCDRKGIIIFDSYGSIIQQISCGTVKRDDVGKVVPGAPAFCGFHAFFQIPSYLTSNYSVAICLEAESSIIGHVFFTGNDVQKAFGDSAKKAYASSQRSVSAVDSFSKTH